MQCIFITQIHTRRVQPRGAVQRGGQRYARVRRAGGRAFALGGVGHGLHRVFDQRVDRHLRVGDAVDERGVGAVFQQAAHQVGQQRFVRAHGGVDAARAAQAALGHRAHHLLIQRLAHAVQALEFVLTGRIVWPGHLHDGRDGVRVVRGELRVDGARRGQQRAGASQVADVGVRLARVNGVVGLAIHLRAFDLAVPVRALDQPHHQAVAAAAAQVNQPVDHARAALLVRLDDKANAVPARQLGREAKLFQQVQRQLQPVGLFGVDVQADVVPASAHRQRQHARVQLGHHASALRAAVARVQRRQLDGNARPADHAAPGAGRANGVDRLLVAGQVACCIVGRQRGFAQHVVAVAKALRLVRAGVLQRLANRFAGDELLAHHAHGHVHRLADQRLAALANQPRQRLAQRLFAVRGHQPAGNQQAPGRRVDEQRRALPQVRLPLPAADLVADQRVARGGVGNAQQRLGQAHQRHAFLRRQRKLLQQPLHQPGAPHGPLALAQRLRQLKGQRVRALGLRRPQLRARQQRRQRLGLGQARGGGDRGAQRRLGVHVGVQGGEGVARRRGGGVAGTGGRRGGGGHGGGCKGSEGCEEAGKGGRLRRPHDAPCATRNPTIVLAN